MDNSVQRHWVIRYSNNTYHGGGHKINHVVSMNKIRYYKNKMAAKSQITRIKKLNSPCLNMRIVPAGIGIKGYYDNRGEFNSGLYEYP